MYDAHKQQTIGFVDLGAGPDESGQEATEALVFMLVGLKSRWKCPIAYFFTRSLSGETQGQLLNHCLKKVSELGLVVHCVTMDGNAANIGILTSTN